MYNLLEKMIKLETVTNVFPLERCTCVQKTSNKDRTIDSEGTLKLVYKAITNIFGDYYICFVIRITCLFK